LYAILAIQTEYCEKIDNCKKNKLMQHKDQKYTIYKIYSGDRK